MAHSAKDNGGAKIFQKLWNLRRLTVPLLAQKLSWIIRELISDWIFDHIVTGQAFASAPRLYIEHLDISSSNPTSTLILKKIFRCYPVQPHNVLVDVGCGRGRTIAWWLHQGYKNRIYGFELHKETAVFAKKAFEKYENVTIKNGNIFDEFPTDADVFYLYNPFGVAMTNEFKAHILETYYPKKEIVIIYYNCRYIEVFRNDPRFDIQETDFPEWSVSHNAGYPWYAIIRMKVRDSSLRSE
ncbi:MAG: methyltransferase domain-containing protein [Nitrospinales bacterium]